MNSTVRKCSIIIGRHRTSISLEDDFWACVRQIARERPTTASEFIGMIDAGRMAATSHPPSAYSFSTIIVTTLPAPR
jgi:predicted DNA-binding ribbon-helix-helix protein